MRASSLMAWAAVGVMVAVPVGILTYPIPRVEGGWCQSGGRPGHYAIEDATKALVRVDVAAAAVLLAALVARFGARRGAGAAMLAAAPVAIALFLTYLLYAGRILCAGS